MAPPNASETEAGTKPWKTRLAHYSHAYVTSGWAFFLPYLLIYLVYAIAERPVAPTPEQSFPALLSVFRCLHVIFLIAIISTILRCIANRTRTTRIPRVSIVWDTIPWISLAAAFVAPGLYLEFPSDTWEHVRRINEWRTNHVVTESPSWPKFTYLLAYSLIGNCETPSAPLYSLYAGAMSLLLCLQTARLGRTLGLGRGESILLLVLQLFTFGNTTFSFFRYYSIGSTIVSQIAAVAMIRIVADYSLSFRDPATKPRSRWATLLLKCVAALTLMAFSHPQAIGIALIGTAAVILVHLWRFFRRAFIVTIVAIGMANAAMPLVPRSDMLESMISSSGWLGPWLGFNLIHPDSPSVARALHILNVFGILNIICAIWIARKKPYVASLTTLPVIALLSPLFAIPFAEILIARVPDGAYIMMFHRILFAIIPCLALVLFARELLNKIRSNPRLLQPIMIVGLTSSAFLFPLFIDRLWHFVAKIPDDLTFRDASTAFAQCNMHLAARNSVFFSTIGLAFAAEAQSAKPTFFHPYRFRIYADRAFGPRSPSLDADQVIRALDEDRYKPFAHVFIPNPMHSFSRLSIAAAASGHWLTQEAILSNVASAEIEQRCKQLGFTLVSSSQAGSIYRLVETNKNEVQEP